MSRPPLPLGTWGKITTYPTDQGFRARTLYRDFDGVTRRVERHGSTKGAAENALRTALRDRIQAGSTASITPETKVNVLAEAWFVDVSSVAKSPGTLRAYRDRLDRQVIPALGNLRVRELTTGVVHRHVQAVSKSNGAAVAKLVRTVLSGMCGLAARLDALERNPVREVGRIAPTAPKRAPKALTAAEARALRLKLALDPKAIARDLPDLVAVMLATGLRIGECLALEWTAIDLDAGTLAVRGTVVWEKTKGLRIKPSPKSAAGERTLELPSWAVELLRGRQGSAKLDQTLVFPSTRGTLRDPSNTEGQLKDAFTDAGFEITSHVLRKTVATLMDEAGLSARAAADQLGHAKPSITMDTYYGRRVRSTGAAQALDVLA